MFVAAGFSFLAIIVCIVSLCSMSYNNSQVKNTNWTYGYTSEFEFYVGLYEIIVIAPRFGEVSFSWKYYEHGYYADCKDACNVSIYSVIFALITCIPTILTDLQRSTVKGDFNCQKVMGVVTGLMGTISTLLALSFYADGCYSNLPFNDAAGEEIAWELGPGFVCLLVATLLKLINLFIHLLMPVEQRDDEGNDLTKNDWSGNGAIEMPPQMKVVQKGTTCDDMDATTNIAIQDNDLKDMIAVNHEDASQA
jgi:hypothetical protein